MSLFDAPVLNEDGLLDPVRLVPLEHITCAVRLRGIECRACLPHLPAGAHPHGGSHAVGLLTAICHTCVSVEHGPLGTHRVRVIAGGCGARPSLRVY